MRLPVYTGLHQQIELLYTWCIEKTYFNVLLMCISLTMSKVEHKEAKSHVHFSVNCPNPLPLFYWVLGLLLRNESKNLYEHSNQTCASGSLSDQSRPCQLWSHMSMAVGHSTEKTGKVELIMAASTTEALLEITNFTRVLTRKGNEPKQNFCSVPRMIQGSLLRS